MVVNGVGSHIVMHYVIYVLDVMFSLISVLRVVKNNYRIFFDTDDSHPRRGVVKL